MRSSTSWSRPAPTHQTRPRTAQRGVAILWIDDRPQNSAVEIASHEAEGHRVIPTRSIGEAEAALRRQSGDVILSDVVRSTGGREGIEHIHKIRQSGDMPPFGFYTSAGALARHADDLSWDLVAASSFVELMTGIRNLAARDTNADELHS